MTISKLDILYTFSGGSSNSDPNRSLGGEPSDQPLLDQQLFSDVSTVQSTNGLTDYHCFYFHNTNTMNTLFNSEISISVIPGDVIMQLGVYSNNERQIVFISNAVNITSGSFVLTYTDVESNYDLEIQWDTDFSVLANNLQTALRTISNLEDVIVNVNLNTPDLNLEIDFLGVAGFRYHDLITLKTNSLSTTIGIEKTVQGGPINNVAVEIDVSTTIPSGVVFSLNPFTFGDLRPFDFVPVWIKRIIPAGTAAIEDDGFTFRLSGTPIK